MKRLLSALLCIILTSSVLVSCMAAPKTDQTASSSRNYADLAWLENRLGALPDGLSLGLASDLGIDMTAFENDGYLIRTDGGEAVVCGKTQTGLDRAVRRFAKLYAAGEADDLDITYHEGVRVECLTVAGNDIADYTIVLPEDKNENVSFAATELQRLIKIATGVTLPIADSAEGHKITFALSDDPALYPNGFTYTVTDGDLHFTSERLHGSPNAVWRFLENECGWFGLTYGDSVLEESDHVDIPEGLSKTETASTEYFKVNSNGFDPYVNEKKTPTSVQDSYGYIPTGGHGMEKYKFVSDVDWVHQLQPCYTDVSRYDECLENVTAFIESKLASGQRLGYELRSVDIAQGDNGGYCHCRTCAKVFQEEQSNAGAVIRFANRLSEELNETYPGLYYLLFAYWGAKEPPRKTVPNEHLFITYCADRSCENHPLDNSLSNSLVQITDCRNKYEAQNIRGWSEITDNLYVWFYALDGALCQYTSRLVLYSNMKFFHSLGVKGIFWEAEYYGNGTKRIEHSLASYMNWNVGMTEDEYEELLCRLLERDFGEGWREIRRYMDIQQTSQSLHTCFLAWDWYDHAHNTFDRHYVSERGEETVALFEEAIRVAASADEEHRIKVLSASAIYNYVTSAYPAAYIAEDEAKLDELRELYRTVLDRLTECGINYKNLKTIIQTECYEDDLDTEVWSHFTTARFTQLYGPIPFYEELSTYPCPYEFETQPE